MDAEKASMLDKTIQSGYKIAYGSYHTAKYIGYGIGYTGLAITLPITLPILFCHDKIKK